jgi:polyisoprenyl-phosphate glycosyltransferase
MYNEHDNLQALLERLRNVIASLKQKTGFEFELVITDNHSTDGSFEYLRKLLATHDEGIFKIRAFRFAKNIGFQKSILVGYGKAQGDAVIQLDADLQDPPELIEEFLLKWKKGYQVVYGVRKTRQESFASQAMRRLFYRLIDRISGDDLPHDTGDFRLVDRKVVDIVCSLKDHSPYLRGLIASLGLRQIGVGYDRSARVRGVSKFLIRDLFSLSWDGIANHSVFPLKLSSYLAAFISLIGVVLAVFYFLAWLVWSKPLPLGFLTQVLLQLVTLAAVAFIMGIQGEYISRIYSQVKVKPLAIVESRISSNDHASAAAVDSGNLQEGIIEVLWVGMSPLDHDPG